MSSANLWRAAAIALWLVLFPVPVAAHGGEAQGGGAQSGEVQGSEAHDQPAEAPAVTVEPSPLHPEAGGATAPIGPLSEFPTLHPLVVHFPIVLLLLAPVFELGGLLLGRRDLPTVATLLAVGGLAGAFVAAQVVHPHTTGLGREAQQILSAHERYATIAQATALLAVLAKLASHLRSSRPRALDLAAVALLLVAAGAVSVAGHYGAELTHLHGVGPRGAFLEQHRAIPEHR